ncbi:MAG TPA: selenocysteine-specific translation elongation factor [Burkholderiales bacterium]|nr:selenocysteine-specific translation elongation factor [Burkholderiales bacterium]
MIVGTAGHVDHGKTSLVRALTGVDTDRLPEEKKRGISIELGYAYLPLETGEVLGFVDVPGHERFIHTMVSGASGINYGLIVVAADDGIMPQTREHVEILYLLGVKQGAVALTKIDRVNTDRVRIVERDITNLLAATFFETTPVFPVSSIAGTGIDALRTHLIAHSKHLATPQRAGRFRLAVDRVFTLDGVGTVVTGTVHSGSIKVGDRVVVTPGRKTRVGEVRVRSLHAQNQRVEHGVSGQRCALNLAGMSKDEIQRGDWIVDPAIALAVNRLDARVTMLAGEERSLKSGASMHFHLGSSHALTRVALLDRGQISAGESGWIQILLPEPLAAWHGDRFILRDASATRTIAGGQIVDPFAPSRYRSTPDRLSILAALEIENESRSLSALLSQSPLGVDFSRFLLIRNVANADTILNTLPVKRIQSEGQDFVFEAKYWDALKQRAVSALEVFHTTHPDEMGPDVSRLRRIAFPKLPDAIAHALVDDILAGGQVQRTGAWLHLPDHAIRLTDQEIALAERIRPLLFERAFDPPWVRDIAKTIGQPESVVRTLLAHLARRGEVFQVVRDLYYDDAAVQRLTAIAGELAEENGMVRAAEFRDRTGLGRKRAVQILEFFDRIGFTRRVRDIHAIRRRDLLSAMHDSEQHK